MSGQKIFVAVLFLIGILFVASIYLGATHPDDRSFKEAPGWADGLGTALVSPQSLKIADLSPTSMNCLQQERIVVPVGTTCTFAIRQTFFGLRVVKLQLVQGTSAMVILTQEDVVPVHQSLPQQAGDTNLKIYPGKAQGKLIIECPNVGGMSSCILVLE